MIILLVRALTLPGAFDGIIYFIKPQWKEIIKPKVWYAAVTQCFFSLAICFGNITMYSSFNRFNQNIYRFVNVILEEKKFLSKQFSFSLSVILSLNYKIFNYKRDATIITTLDTATSLLAGCIIFGILGNLSHETGVDIKNVVQGGTGLAFITYPDALAKFQTYPQVKVTSYLFVTLNTIAFYFICQIRYFQYYSSPCSSHSV